MISITNCCSFLNSYKYDRDIGSVYDKYLLGKP